MNTEKQNIYAHIMADKLKGMLKDITSDISYTISDDGETIDMYMKCMKPVESINLSFSIDLVDVEE